MFTTSLPRFAWTDREIFAWRATTCWFSICIKNKKKIRKMLSFPPTICIPWSPQKSSDGLLPGPRPQRAGAWLCQRPVRSWSFAWGAEPGGEGYSVHGPEKRRLNGIKNIFLIVGWVFDEFLLVVEMCLIIQWHVTGDYVLDGFQATN